MGINAAYLGAKSVNPNVKFKIIWVSSWFDPGKEADAAKALTDQGADVLFQHTDSPAPMKLAEQQGIYAVGQASDMKAYRPERAAHRDHGQLDALLHRARQGGDGRHLEIDRHLGRAEIGHAEAGALEPENSRRRRQARRGRRSTRSNRARFIPSPGR